MINHTLPFTDLCELWHFTTGDPRFLRIPKDLPVSFFNSFTRMVNHFNSLYDVPIRFMYVRDFVFVLSGSELKIVWR